jgi:phage terminase large subunit-like protein
VVWPKIQKLWGPFIKKQYGVRDGIPNRIQFLNDSILDFRSYEQGAKRFEGTDYDIAWFDEPPPQDVWFSVLRGLTDRGGAAIFTMTPDIDQAWVYESFEVSPMDGSEVVFISIWDNAKSNGGYLDDKYIQSFIDTINDEQRSWRIEGEWPHLSGRIYKSWDPSIHVIDTPKIEPHWPRYAAFDPHDRKPWAMLWAVVTPRDELIFIGEWPDCFWHHDTRSYLRAVSDYAEIIRDMERDFVPEEAPIVRILDPRYARTPSVQTGHTLEDELWGNGIEVVGRLSDDFHKASSVNTGHHQVSEFLQSNQLFVDNSLFGNLRRAFDYYSWDEASSKSDDRHGVKEAPQRKYKHFMDCVRMIADYGPVYYERDKLEGIQRFPTGVTGYGA